MKALFELDNLVTVENICNTCLAEKRMMGIIGYPGAGKTVSLQHYAEKHERVYYMRIRKSMTIKDFFASLLEVIGQQNNLQGHSIYPLINSIAEELTLNQRGKLIIIDEAGKFKPGQLEYIHELRDLVDETTGIVLAGPEYFYDHLISWEKANVKGIPELVRRINSFIWLDRPKFSEVSAICAEYDIKDKKTIQEIFKKGKNFAKIMDLIQAIIESRKDK